MGNVRKVEPYYMFESNEGEQRHQVEFDSDRQESLDKIRGELDCGSYYLEELYKDPDLARRAREEVRVAKERVPEELRSKARIINIRLDIEDGVDVPQALLDYKLAIEENECWEDEQERELRERIAGMSPEQVYADVMNRYDTAMADNPEDAIQLAYIFLGDTKKDKAEQRSLELALERFNEEEDIEAKYGAGKTILERAKNLQVETGVLKEVIEFLILHKETDKHYTNYLRASSFMELHRKGCLPKSDIIYWHARDSVRYDFDKRWYRHEIRQQILEKAQEYFDAGLLSLEHDADILDALTDKTPYEKEQGKFTKRWEKAERDLLEGSTIGVGRDITLHDVQDLFKNKLPQIEEGLLRNFYLRFRGSLNEIMRGRVNSWVTNTGEDIWKKDVAKMRLPLDKDTSIVLEVGWKDADSAECAGRQLGRLNIVYSDDVRIELRGVKIRWNRRLEREDVDLLGEEVPNVTATVQEKFTETLKDIIRPSVDVEDALRELVATAGESGLDDEGVEKLTLAIQQYAQHHKPPPLSDSACWGEVGRCLHTPNNFSRFCKENFDMQVGTMHYGNGISFYHEVSVIDGVVVDWTARQFPQLRDKSYPHVYLASESKTESLGVLKGGDYGDDETFREMAPLLASGVEF